MSDPSTVLTQMRRYASEGRLEMAEVMASELTERMIGEKERDLVKQDLLVQGLRDLANILEIRGTEKPEKLKLSLNANKELAKQRSRLVKMHKEADSGNAAQEVLAARADDEVQAGRVLSAMGKRGKAMSRFNKAFGLRKGHIEASTEAVAAELRARGDLRKAGKWAGRLVDSLADAGPVSRASGAFLLTPAGQRPADVPALLERVSPWTAATLGMPEVPRSALSSRIENLSTQIQRIESGEQAADAALAAAVDKLNPTMDYHAFSKS